MVKNKSNSTIAILKEIYSNSISISESEKKMKVMLVQQFIKNDMIPIMKRTDILFNILYQEIFHTGSYFDGLRVNNANEFDLNVLLKIPGLKESAMHFEDKQCDPGFATLKILGNVQEHFEAQQKMYSQVELLKRKLLQQENNGWVLRPEKTRRWLQSILCKVLNGSELKHYYDKIGIESISLKESGPAMTLQILLNSNCQVDVDIVPAFVFKCRQILELDYVGDELQRFWESHMEAEFEEYGTLAIDENFFLIPKSKHQDSPQWRLSFTDLEKKILYQHGCAKMVIKLLKYFRDCNPELQGLSSYSLKTLVMLMIRKDPTFEWKEEKLSNIFLDSLTYLHQMLENEFLPFYFHPQSNVIEKLSKIHIFNMKCWLAKAKKKLELSKDAESCKSIWTKYFKQDDSHVIDKKDSAGKD